MKHTYYENCSHKLDGCKVEIFAQISEGDNFSNRNFFQRKIMFLRLELKVSPHFNSHYFSTIKTNYGWVDSTTLSFVFASTCTFLLLDYTFWILHSYPCYSMPCFLDTTLEHCKLDQNKKITEQTSRIKPLQSAFIADIPCSPCQNRTLQNLHLHLYISVYIAYLVVLFS